MLWCVKIRVSNECYQPYPGNQPYRGNPWPCKGHWNNGVMTRFRSATLHAPRTSTQKLAPLPRVPQVLCFGIPCLHHACRWTLLSTRTEHKLLTGVESWQLLACLADVDQVNQATPKICFSKGCELKGIAEILLPSIKMPPRHGDTWVAGAIKDAEGLLKLGDYRDLTSVVQDEADAECEISLLGLPCSTFSWRLIHLGKTWIIG